MIPASRIGSILLIAISLGACVTSRDVTTGEPAIARDAGAGTVEATSLLGKPLRRPELSREQEALFTHNLARAESAFASDPTDETNIIWLARRQAYLGRYNDTIDTLTDGLTNHPDSVRILRHRGHRFITIRQLDKAIADLSRAAELIEDNNLPDEVEPDGLPNARNMPRSTTNSNVYYHLGLAQYLQHDFASAKETYLKCLEYASFSDDMLVATTYWLYHTYRRLGEDATAQRLLDTALRPEMQIIENHTYLDLLRMYAGQASPGALSGETADPIHDATLAYGLANYDYCNGRTERAIERLEAIIDTPTWAAFGYIAAEADLAALHAQPPQRPDRPDDAQETARRVHDLKR